MSKSTESLRSVGSGDLWKRQKEGEGEAEKVQGSGDCMKCHPVINEIR